MSKNIDLNSYISYIIGNVITRQKKTYLCGYIFYFIPRPKYFFIPKPEEKEEKKKEEKKEKKNQNKKRKKE